MPVVLATTLQVASATFWGLPGASGGGRCVGGTAGGAPPSSGTFLTGDWVVDLLHGGVWFCTAGGTPGTWVNPTPFGIVSWNRSTAGATATATELIGLTTTAVLRVERCYRIRSGPVMGQSSVMGDYMNLFLRQSAAGGAVTITSTLLDQNIISCPVANNINDAKHVEALVNAPTSGTYQFGLDYLRASGTGQVLPQVAATRPLLLMVEDMGPALTAVA